jgi:hypothetical protein
VSSGYYLPADAIPFPGNGGVPQPKLRPSTPEELAVARSHGAQDNLAWTIDPATGYPKAYPPASRAQRIARKQAYKGETVAALNDALRSLIGACAGVDAAAEWTRTVSADELRAEPFDDGLPAPSKGQKLDLLVEIRRQRRILDSIDGMDDSQIPSMPHFNMGPTPVKAPTSPTYVPISG